MKLEKGLLKACMGGWFTLYTTVALGQTATLQGVSETEGMHFMHAQVDLQGKVLAGVEATGFRMTDGWNQQRNEYKLHNNQFLTVALPDMGGAQSTYRLKLSFADGTELLTPCVNEQGRDPFMWLGDYAWTEGVTGWGGHPPRVDIGVENAPGFFNINDVAYHKGISNHARGHVLYDLEGPFTEFVANYGVEDKRSTGAMGFIFSTNGQEVINQRMYSKGGNQAQHAPYVREARFPMEGVTTLRIDFDPLGYNGGDHGHVAMARLYMPQTEVVEKQPQQITFQTQGGTIPATQRVIALQATASSGQPVHYFVAEGTAGATIENGHELHLNYGYRGEVVVMAVQQGSEQVSPATAMLRLQMNLKPDLVFLSEELVGTDTVGHFFVDMKNRAVDRIRLMNFSNRYTLDTASVVEIAAVDGAELGLHFVAPINNSQLTRMEVRFADSQELFYSGYFEGDSIFDYASEFPAEQYTLVTGWSTAQVDKAISGATLQLAGQQYRRGFGIHAHGSVDIRIPANQYARFATAIGTQQGHTGLMHYTLKMNGVQIDNTGSVPLNEAAMWSEALASDVTDLRMEIRGVNGVGSAHSAVAGTRFYYPVATKQPQTMTWKREHWASDTKPFRIALDAQTSSQLPPVYQLVKGGDIARIEQGNQLYVFGLTSEDTLVVQAFQPGDLTYDAVAEPLQCRFYLHQGRVVQRDEKITLQGGDVVNELIVYGDAQSFGQVFVQNGVAQVNKLTVRYSMEPGAWNFVSFPLEVDLQVMTNLDTLGYALNGEQGKHPYFLRYYDTELRANDPTQSSWTRMTTPKMKAHQGYLLGLGRQGGEAPVEVEFTFENVALDFESGMQIVEMTIDMADTPANTQQAVYIAPKGVTGNRLKVMIDFQPKSTEGLPINHAHALKQARVTYTPQKAGVRLTLPDQSPAKVAIFSKESEELVKSLTYISPNLIDIRDLQQGNYLMVVEYGGHTEIKEFVK